MKIQEYIMSGKKVMVLGDITLDENIYQGERNSPELKGSGTLIRKTPGGAYLLYEYISHLINRTKHKTGKSGNLQHKCFFIPRFENAEIPEPFMTYALWVKMNPPKPEGDEEKKEARKNQGTDSDHWGLSAALGYGRVADQTEYFLTKKMKEKELPEQIDILVLDDSGTLFHQAEELWSPVLKKLSNLEGSSSWIILKSCFPLAKGNLFKKLAEEYRDRLVIVTSIDEIRKEDALISKGVSWEQTALDLVFELSSNHSLKRLLNCKYLIITLHSEGALYIEAKEGKIWKCRLIFDPEFLEGEWHPKEGIIHQVIGLMSCFTAAVAYSFLDKDINLEMFINRGLAAMRRYKIMGNISLPGEEPSFPFAEIAKEIFSRGQPYASAFVPIPGVAQKDNVAHKSHCPANSSLCGNPRPTNFRSSSWTILEGKYMLDSNLDPLYDTGLRLALDGEGVLANTPKLCISKLTTYDRKEIESLRNLQNLITDYKINSKGKKPLSLAVFGAPGSGKSYAVEQLAEHLHMPFLEFNLSQFSSEIDLEGAFHQVRDSVLTGKLPCVFWDEFDSQNYKWLQYLLAPMQDGRFQTGQITHPIGKCVFIFAGGTSYTYETFGVRKPCAPSEKQNSTDQDYDYKNQSSSYREFKLNKGPDFKSRLNGYINVLGPNPRNCLDERGEIRKEPSGNERIDKADVFFPIRRAMFIRSILGAKENERLNIDLGLLYALIHITKYEHGSRTLEQILRQIQSQVNNQRLLRSGLPSSSNMAMLVNYDEFLKLLHEDHANDFLAFEVAPCIHANWCKIAEKDQNRIYYHKLFNKLPAHLQQENIQAARRIPQLLLAIGLSAEPENEREFSVSALKHDFILDNNDKKILARLEHIGWVKTKEDDNWKYSSVRNDDFKQHNNMLSWESISPPLTRKTKNKDSRTVSKIPEELKKARFAIVEHPANNINTIVNAPLLAEVSILSLWREYRKIKPLWAKLLSHPETITTNEGKLQFKPGDYICRGEAGDVWGQKAETLHNKYVIDESTPPDPDGWQKYLPDPETGKVLAAEIGHSFQVSHPDYGTMSGEAGDFLVKSFADRDVDLPEDIWIVGSQIFLETYKLLR
jgi:hypothetical protein